MRSLGIIYYNQSTSKIMNHHESGITVSNNGFTPVIVLIRKGLNHLPYTNRFFCLPCTTVFFHATELEAHLIRTWSRATIRFYYKHIYILKTFRAFRNYKDPSNKLKDLVESEQLFRVETIGSFSQFNYRA